MDHLNLNLGDEFRPKNYRVGSYFNPKVHDFHTFPETVGWGLDDTTFKLEVRGQAHETPILKFDDFLQAWLFFGLMATIFQEDKAWNHEDFAREHGIYTDRLPGYLRRWEERETEKKNERTAQTFRMIKAQVALDKARKVVIKYCSSQDGKQQLQSPNAVNSALGLSLMVLGETLTNAKSKIVERVGFNVRGWHGDANEGWGTPSCALSQMRAKGWCPRTTQMLEGQLRSHATSILSVYKSHQEANFTGHQECTAARCVRRSTEDDKKTYKTQHQPNCKHSEESPCIMVGPDIDKIAEVLREGQIPLLEYKEQRDTWVVDVKVHKVFDNYATISHVWADGYGNPKSNRLWKCQLDFFKDLFESVKKQNSTLNCKLFWIDTLAIPVDKKFENQRKAAINQINEIFSRAKFTIVIDNELTRMHSGSNYQDTAMKILASGWMRRLWTLQEAYLSRRLLFAFKDENVRNLDDLEEMYPEASHVLESSIPTTARSYFHNLLGPHRNAGLNKGPGSVSYNLLASIWRAAQWRTGRPEHETLALATMLNLDYQESSFSRAGLLSDNPVTTLDAVSKATGKTAAELEQMMKDLWVLLDETCPGSIPSGIIFLPGERMSAKGFGWAPKSWMSGQKVDYPDPLSTMVSAAQLDREKGLLVQYPGFRLHVKHSNSVLWPNQQPIRFPSDSTLLEWYEVDKEDEPRIGTGTTLERDAHADLAIVLCRPKPRETAEIALLVKIEREIPQRGVGTQKISKIFQVYMICRVSIQRKTALHQISEWKKFIHQPEHRDDGFIFGEVLENDQQWYIDGFPDPSTQTAQAAPPTPPAPSALALSTNQVSEGFTRKLLNRTFTGFKTVRGSREESNGTFGELNLAQPKRSFTFGFGQREAGEAGPSLSEEDSMSPEVRRSGNVSK